MLAVQGAGNGVTVKNQTLTDAVTVNPAISGAMVAVCVVRIGKEFAGTDAVLDTLNIFTAVGTGVSRWHRPVKRSAMVVSSHHDAVVVICVHVPAQRQLLLVSWQRAPVASSLALARAGNNRAARMAMIAMTTSNSIKVNPKVAWCKGVVCSTL